eukprot:1164408-Lingulodinium_polyedra.AAC.1
MGLWVALLCRAAVERKENPLVGHRLPAVRRGSGQGPLSAPVIRRDILTLTRTSGAGLSPP